MTGKQPDVTVPHTVPPEPRTVPPVRGLSRAAADRSRAEHGRNVFSAGHRTGVLVTLRQVFTEPMFLLLLLTCAVYLGLGQGDQPGRGVGG